MKQTTKIIEARERVRKYVSFHRIFGRPDPQNYRKHLSTNLSAKLSGHLTNNERNSDLTDDQVKEIRDKLGKLRIDIDSYLKSLVDENKH